MKKLIENKLILVPILIIISFFIGTFIAISSINSSTQNNEFSIKNGNWIVNPKMDLKPDCFILFSKVNKLWLF